MYSFYLPESNSQKKKLPQKIKKNPFRLICDFGEEPSIPITDIKNMEMIIFNKKNKLKSNTSVLHKSEWNLNKYVFNLYIFNKWGKKTRKQS